MRLIKTNKRGDGLHGGPESLFWIEGNEIQMNTVLIVAEQFVKRRAICHSDIPCSWNVFAIPASNVTKIFVVLLLIRKHSEGV